MVVQLLRTRLYRGVTLGLSLALAFGCEGLEDSVPCEELNCGEYSTCNDDGEEAICVCQDGYDGIDCRQCSEGYWLDDDGECVTDPLVVDLCGTENPCGDYGTCDDSLGERICLCDDGYDGEFCALCYPGYHDAEGICILDMVCLPTSCAGHGVCDDSSGTPVCVCDDAYQGDNCESCADVHHRDAEDNCVPDEDCATSNPCGENGTCDDSSGVVSCECNEGYTGEFCDTCYPGYHDDGAGNCILDDGCMPNTCSSHGTCNDTGSVITCTCDDAYMGDHCESCNAGYHRDAEDNCTADDDCAVTDPCGSHGTCDDVTGLILCICDMGHDGEFCDSCYPGYHDDGSGNCVFDERCLASTCSGHGTCDDSSGVISCACDGGYSGAYCESCAAGYHRDADGSCVPNDDCSAGDPCGANGTCDDSSGVVECVCNLGYDGVFCTECYPGYHDDGAGNCVFDSTCLSGTCSGHGTCSDSSGVVTCSCYTGYTGAYCSSCSVGYHRDAADNCVPDESCSAGDPCGTNGSCDDSSGVVECICDMGYDGDFCVECYPGYHDDGTGACVLDETCLPGTCSEHGICDEIDGVVSCRCNRPYDGPNCDICAAGFHRDEATDLCVEDEDCAVTDPCGGDGTCNDSTGVIECVCDMGYAGVNCDTCDADYHRGETGDCDVDEDCDVTDPCGDHGTCVDATGMIVCTCDSDWDGEHCDRCDDEHHMEVDVCVVNEECEVDSCSYVGTCRIVDGLVECECDTGYDGDRCEECYPGYERELLTNNCGIPCFSQYEVRCDGDCHCGVCGNVCDEAVGEKCINGRCMQSDCDIEDFCPPDELCCEGEGPYCADADDLMIDFYSCGGCDQCDSDFFNECAGGNCIDASDSCECGDDEICCGTTCIDEAIFIDDESNCGGCDVLCDSNEECLFGQCRCIWPSLQCGDECVDFLFDDNNCGVCDNACEAGERCVVGFCIPTDPDCNLVCRAEDMCCDVNGQECVDIRGMATNPEHCGGCEPCEGDETCSLGRCTCEHDICDGVCTDTDWSETQCGGCGSPPCDTGNGELCINGVCRAPTSSDCSDCGPDELCCASPIIDGASECVLDTDFMDDNNHCGECGRECPCVFGICSPT